MLKEVGSKKETKISPTASAAEIILSFVRLTLVILGFLGLRRDHHTSRRHRSPQGLSHVIQRWRFTGEEFKLTACLSNEHLDPAHSWTASFASVFQKQSLLRVVHGVEDQR